MLTGNNLFTFIITSPTGRVLDFGTYYSAVCAEDTAHDYPGVTEPGTMLTIVRHDDDGSHEIVSEAPLLAKQED